MSGERKVPNMLDGLSMMNLWEDMDKNYVGWKGPDIFCYTSLERVSKLMRSLINLSIAFKS